MFNFLGDVYRPHTTKKPSQGRPVPPFWTDKNGELQPYPTKTHKKKHIQREPIFTDLPLPLQKTNLPIKQQNLKFENSHLDCGGQIYTTSLM